MKESLLLRNSEIILAIIIPFLIVALFLVIFQIPVNEAIQSVAAFFGDEDLIGQLNWKALR